jgi:hypothetical protein
MMKVVYNYLFIDSTGRPCPPVGSTGMAGACCIFSGKIA